MTMIENAYPPGWHEKYNDYTVKSFHEQSPHTSATAHVLQRGESISVTEQEDEYFERLTQLAGVAE